ncbi:MAG: hypothetical protein LBP69_09815 [Treponema sp.]|jgi:hypothetical protein|nr:hypothetical protein [Treponema sp.]
MTRREELQKQYAEYERKIDEARETRPPNEVCGFGENSRITAVYIVEFNELEITCRFGDGTVREVLLSADEAEKLYHFLGGLYGG